MTLSYTVAIDYDDDGDFTNTGENITSDVLAMTWRLGMAAPYDSMAAPSTARITVRSVSRSYSPEYTAEPLLPGKRVRIQSSDGVTTRTHFTGPIRYIEPLPGDQGERTAVIHVCGPEHHLSQNRARLPLQVDVTADEVIDAILDAVFLRQPALKGYWVLDSATHMALGTSTRLAEDYPRSLQTGRSTFACVGDTWTDGIPAAQAIRQLVEAEHGRFFTDRSGQLIFYNRHHTLTNITAQATFDDDMAVLEYAFGANVINHVQVRMTPRKVGAAGTTLWTLDSAQRILPGQAYARQIVARFRDDKARPIGALAVISPAPFTDYTANTAANGTGTDRTTQLRVLLAAVDASAATLLIRNDSGQTLYLQPGAKLRGTPLYKGDPAALEQTDWTSVTFYGLSGLEIALPALTSIEEADELARFELARRKDPRGVVRSIQVSAQDSSAHQTQALARTLFDRITVHETQTNHAADCFIVAEEHAVDLGGMRHRVTWLLEPAADFWIVASGKLDQTTVLAY